MDYKVPFLLFELVNMGLPIYLKHHYTMNLFYKKKRSKILIGGFS